MKRRDLRDYLQDVLDAIDDIDNFVGSMTYEQYLSKTRKP